MGRIAGYEGRERPKFLVVLCVFFFFYVPGFVGQMFWMCDN